MWTCAHAAGLVMAPRWCPATCELGARPALKTVVAAAAASVLPAHHSQCDTVLKRLLCGISAYTCSAPRSLLQVAQCILDYAHITVTHPLVIAPPPTTGAPMHTARRASALPSHYQTTGCASSARTSARRTPTNLRLHTCPPPPSLLPSAPLPLLPQQPRQHRGSRCQCRLQMRSPAVRVAADAPAAKPHRRLCMHGKARQGALLTRMLMPMKLRLGGWGDRGSVRRLMQVLTLMLRKMLVVGCGVPHGSAPGLLRRGREVRELVDRWRTKQTRMKMRAMRRSNKLRRLRRRRRRR